MIRTEEEIRKAVEELNSALDSGLVADEAVTVLTTRRNTLLWTLGTGWEGK